jgi:hypothetical protein
MAAVVLTVIAVGRGCFLPQPFSLFDLEASTFGESAQFTLIKEIEEDICHRFISITKVHEIDHKSNTLHIIHRK